MRLYSIFTALLLLAPLGALLLLAPLAGCSRPPEIAPLRAEAELLEGGTAIALLVENLRPGERVTEVRLLGPAGLVAETRDIWHGRREIGGLALPGIGLEGSSSRGVGLSIELVWPPGRFVDRPAESSGFARARLALPDPAAFAAAPMDYRLEVRYRRLEGGEQRLLLAIVKILS